MDATIFTAAAVGLAIALGVSFFLNPDGFSNAFDVVNVVALALAAIGYVYQSVLEPADWVWQ